MKYKKIDYGLYTKIHTSVIGPFEGRNRRKTAAFEEKERAASPRQCTLSKIHELGFELLPHPPYSPDLAPRDYFLFSDLKRMLGGKKFSSNEEVIAETQAYFEAKDKSYYKSGIEKLAGRYNQCITLEGNYIE
ncbi:hypothetical protein GWI33_021776 [Rhynchophorus ferrugineus]|uniref:Histone-lysine N-methyltransferase SETMAR n=1 Tax=Rhynchophorus ferrugineus TaxID=354439 RepID=A0A834HMJ1_RHYFE|nr:hypothetical protein GWI33_021776 [Rhynchophorus ferrugineus]